MARIPFQRPKHIEWEINTDRYGRLVAEPFEKGYALTVGNSLRRTLLSIIPGAAVAWVRIEGTRDQEAHIPGVQEVTGADVSEATGIEVLNPELHIATLDQGGSLAIELGIGIGRGYVAADKHSPGTIPAGAIPMDAAFSPIQKVSYGVENARLGKITDYERLIVEIWTNGAVSPDEALTRAA